MLQIQMTYVFTESLPYLLNRVGSKISEVFMTHLREHELTVPMFRVLATVDQNGAQRLSDLAEKTSIEMSTLSRLIGTMSKRGLVSRTRLEDNARTVSITLTPKSTELIRTLTPIAEQFDRIGDLSMNEAELQRFKARLRDLYDTLDALTKQAMEARARAE